MRWTPRWAASWHSWAAGSLMALPRRWRISFSRTCRQHLKAPQSWMRRQRKTRRKRRAGSGGQRTEHPFHPTLKRVACESGPADKDRKIMNDIVEIKDLRKSYKGGFEALKG